MCTFCKGKLIPATTEYIEKIENYIIVIKNVPCEKCEQCGEEYFSTDVARQIEKILNNIQTISSEITVSVINYESSAAA
ncbi:type II toxin-antitoxin system MqsA family antitoxin [Eubacterium limosum]|uniref:Type II toxin-antitoxin system MqsA family antitoxin n=1 Tax=Eubacterium limosum TaxID=1736 RepID=A0ABT5UJY1_EUBLI|nr:type II toxin-antitoxin system MqsA family antitoxin [Eubacterium limosum]MCB6568469.1 type II toxin-antitoxin system MqsA family antitoxin [Eubacterium limosum]MDE1468774.1 type II toxin-antitoxin system MqsA family antitoxin [Eubacterium limosum]